jgi:uncharacterized protein YndB with AHSA1/START domain
MENEKIKITIEITVNSNIENAWKTWTTATDIMQWNTASEEWHTTNATIDLREGGKFCSHMEAKDGSFGFDFSGVYTKIIVHEQINYIMDDGRTCEIVFQQQDNNTRIVQTFEAETENSVELQKGGWQAIMNNFKNYLEKK